VSGFNPRQVEQKYSKRIPRVRRPFTGVKLTISALLAANPQLHSHAQKELK
jgi:hypothetical protein